MIKLSREIRFALVPLGRINQLASANSWSGWPSTNLVVPHLILRCEIEGQPDPQSGYLCNIKRIDDLLRKIVVEQLIPEYDGTQTAESMVRSVFIDFCDQWKLPPNVASITLALSPFLSYTICSKEPKMIQLTQQFEFSAAHRLHCEDYSDEQNLELFGKCNNPEGHGHNYVVEVTIGREMEADDLAGQVFNLANFESIVKELVVDRLDHKHLNRDVKLFANVNPSVENIASALFDWLDGKFEPASLQKIRVYETPKTWAECGKQTC